MNRQSTSLGVLFLVVFTELIGFGLIIPVLPQLAKVYQLNYYSLGILMSAFSFAQFFAAPILGHLSDVYGRKTILMVSKFGTVLSYVILAFSSSYWMFLFARLLDGFTGGNIAVARAYICDVTDTKSRAKGMAIIGISFGLGFVVGPALGGWLHNDKNGQFITSIVAASLSLLAFIFTWGFLKEPPKKEPFEKKQSLYTRFSKLNSPELMMLCGAYCLYMISFSGFETTFVVFTEYVFKLTTKQNSLLFMYAGLIGLCVQGVLSRKASSHFSEYTILGLGVLCCGFLGLAFAKSIVSLMVFMAFVSVGISFVNTFMPALLTSYCEEKARGLVLGVYESIGSMSRIVGPLIAYAISIEFIYIEYICFSVILFIIGLMIMAQSVFFKKKMA